MKAESNLIMHTHTDNDLRLDDNLRLSTRLLPRRWGHHWEWVGCKNFNMVSQLTS